MTKQELAKKYGRALGMTLEYLQRKASAIDAEAVQDETVFADRSETMHEVMKAENAIREVIMRLFDMENSKI